MTKNNIISINMADINKAGNTILRTLYIEKGYTYNNPVAFFEINGPFTINQVKKVAEMAGFNVYTSLITLLVKNPHFNDEYDIATLTTGDTVNTDFNYVWFDRKEYGARVHRYICKGAFNENRKKENAHTFIICQLKDYIAKPEKKPVDIYSRFNVVEVHKWCKEYGGTSYIGDIDTTRTDAAGQKWTYKKTFKGAATRLDEVIDKSGYIVDIRRDELKRRANGLRSERAKNAYIETNNAAKIEELRNMIEAKKADIIQALNGADNAAELEKICEKLNTWRGLPAIIKDFERLEAADAEKKYNSVESFEKNYTYIFTAVDAL